MEIFVAESLAVDEDISFNAGNHTEMIQLKFKGIERLVKPTILKFSWKTVLFPNNPSERWAQN